MKLLIATLMVAFALSGCSWMNRYQAASASLTEEETPRLVCGILVRGGTSSVSCVAKDSCE